MQPAIIKLKDDLTIQVPSDYFQQPAGAGHYDGHAQADGVEPTVIFDFFLPDAGDYSNLTHGKTFWSSVSKLFTSKSRARHWGAPCPCIPTWMVRLNA